MLHAFLIAWLGVAAAQASPGPNMMAVAATAFAQGRAPALMVVAGISSGSLVWALATAAGLGALFAAAPVLLTVLKFAGGAYLLYLALRGALAAIRGTTTIAATAAAERPGLVAAWRRGFLVVMTNPKSALMWSAIATFLFGAGLDAWQVFAFGPVVRFRLPSSTAATGYCFRPALPRPPTRDSSGGSRPRLALPSAPLARSSCSMGCAISPGARARSEKCEAVFG